MLVKAGEAAGHYKRGVALAPALPCAGNKEELPKISSAIYVQIPLLIERESSVRPSRIQWFFHLRKKQYRVSFEIFLLRLE